LLSGNNPNKHLFSLKFGQGPLSLAGYPLIVGLSPLFSQRLAFGCTRYGLTEYARLLDPELKITGRSSLGMLVGNRIAFPSSTPDFFSFIYNEQFEGCKHFA